MIRAGITVTSGSASNAPPRTGSAAKSSAGISTLAWKNFKKTGEKWPQYYDHERHHHGYRNMDRGFYVIFFGGKKLTGKERTRKEVNRKKAVWQSQRVKEGDCRGSG